MKQNELISPSKIASTEQKIDALRVKIAQFEAQAQQASKNTASANSQVANSLDALAKAYAMEAERASRRYNVSEIQAYRMQVHQLEAEIKKIEQSQGQLFAAPLRQELDQVNAKIREMGQALGGVNNEIAKNASETIQNIKAISSSNGAKKVWESVSVMPIGSIDEAKAKLEALYALLHKVQGTPLLPKSQVDSISKMIHSVNNELREMYKQQEKTSTPQKSAAEIAKEREIQKNRELIRQEDEKTRIINDAIQAAGKFNAVVGTIRDKFPSNLEGFANIKREVGQLVDIIEKMGAALSHLSVGDILFGEFEDIRRRASIAYEVIHREQKRLLAADIGGGHRSEFDSLKEKINDLSSGYSELSKSEKRYAQNREMLDKLQELKRELKSAQDQMSRPISMASIYSMPQNTLDNIREKMSAMQKYMGGLNTTKDRQEIKALNDAYRQLQKEQNKILEQNARIGASNNALTRSFNYMKSRLAFYFTVGASTQFVRSLIDIRGQYEMTEKALGVLINSAERGTQIFNELSRMALVSPYTLIELSTAAKQLVAYNIAAKDVVDTTRRLADMASAVGAPVERLTYALGQIKAYGYLNSRDNRMFANMGISLVNDLAKMYTRLEGHLVSVADVYDRIKKKQVSYEDTMQVINAMTDEGGRFFDFQAKMADTLKVQLANLTLAYNNMLNEMGASSQPIISGSINALKSLFLAWKDIESILTQVVIAFGAYKAWQIAASLAVGTTSRALTKQALATKAAAIADVQKKATTQQLTVAEKQLLATSKQVTSADYQLALSGRTLTTQQAQLLVAFNRNNTALMAAIMRMGMLSKAEIRTALNAGVLGVAIKGVGLAVKSLGRSMLALVMNNPFLILIGLISSIVTHFANAKEATRDFNKGIADGAKEASKSIGVFMKSMAKTGDLQLAMAGALNESNAEKVWEALRNEIEKSAMSSKSVVRELLAIEDINDRLKKGFGLLASIQNAQDALAGLYNELEISQDSLLLGAFGEGLAEDLEDFRKSFEATKKLMKAGIWELDSPFDAVGDDLEEAQKEVENFAINASEVIREKLGREGVKDPVRLREAITRIKDEVKKENPQIRGEAAKLFDIGVDKIFAEQFKGVYSQATGFIESIIDQAKKDSASVFGDITDSTKKLSNEQLNALEEASNKIRETVPPAYRDSFDEAWNDFKSREDLIIPIKVAFEVKEQNELQQDFQSHFIEDIPTIEAPLDYANVESLDEVLSHIPTMTQQAKDEAKEYAKSMNKVVLMSQENEEISKRNAFYNSLNLKDTETKVQWEKRLQDTYNEKLKALQLEEYIMRNTADHSSVAFTNAYNTAKILRGELDMTKNVIDYEKFRMPEVNGKKSGGSKKDPLAEALKQELSIINEVQSNYKKLRKVGIEDTEAIDISTQGYEKTLESVNKELKKYGLNAIDPKVFAGMDTKGLVDALEAQLNTLYKGGKAKTASLKELEVKIQKLKVESEEVDMQNLIKDIDNKFKSLKDEYSLAVELDADPEFGNIFANVFGIDMNELTRTFDDVKRKVQLYAIDLMKGDGIIKIGDSSEFVEKFGVPFDILTSDLSEFAKKFNRAIDSDFMKKLSELQSFVKDNFKKTTNDTIKEWDSLVEKYGSLEDKLFDITKDMAKETVGLIRRFGNDDELTKALNLQRLISIEPDASKVAELQKELKDLMEKVVSGTPSGMTIATGITNSEKEKQAKAIWEDFKSSDDYVKMFDDLERVSTASLTSLMKLMDGVKDKIKDSPEAMKAWLDAYKKNRDEIEGRNPLKTFVDGFKDFISSQNKISEAKKDLKKANNELSVAQSEFDKVEKDTTASEEKRIEVSKKLLSATEKQKTAQKNLKDAEDASTDSIAKMSSGLISLQAIYDQTGRFIDQFADLIGVADDSDFGSFLQGLSKGFAILASAIGVVIAALELAKVAGISAQAACWWLFAVGAALASVVGLLTFIIGRKDREITKQIKESERQVKRLENAYKSLERTVEKSLGNAEIRARRLAIANKELQLAELERQLALEQSRSEKKKDQDKIIDLEGEIIDTRNEIEDLSHEIANTLLGSDVKSAAEDFVDTWVDAWKQGEDTMKALEGRFDEMIETMIKKSLASNLVNKRIEKLWDLVDSYTSDNSELGESLSMGELLDIKARLGDKSLIEKINEDLKNLYGALGIGFGSGNGSNLSNLQQGIQSITEDTASALEAYMNSVSQQVYYQSDILTQINEKLGGMTFNRDVEMATNGQMLLQLQNSYQMQMSIRNILDGWSSPNGGSVRVQMI